MRRTIWALLVVGLCGVGWFVAEPTLARVRGSPYSGQYIGPIPGTSSIWPITINGKGKVSSDVESQPQPPMALTWGSIRGDVDKDGLMHCTGVEFIRTSEGGFQSVAIDFKANVIVNEFGAIVGETGTGDALSWPQFATVSNKR